RPPGSPLFPYTTLFRSRLRLDPAEGAEQRQHAGADALTVHPGEVEVHLVECLGQRFLAHSGLQYFDAGLVAHDTRFRGPGAQGVDRKSTRLNSSHVSIS